MEGVIQCWGSYITPSFVDWHMPIGERRIYRQISSKIENGSEEYVISEVFLLL